MRGLIRPSLLVSWAGSRSACCATWAASRFWRWIRSRRCSSRGCAGGWIARQILEVGYRSQPVVIITGAFTGAVFAAQIFFQFRTLGMESGTGALVATAMCRELGPVLTGLMLAGRVGAAMSAEIGTMKVTEQIDALRALAVYPVDYLVVPRAVAMCVSVPLLVGECVFFGVLASYYVGVVVLDIQGLITWKT